MHKGWSNECTWMVSTWLNNLEITASYLRNIALDSRISLATKVHYLKSLVEEQAKVEAASGLTENLVSHCLHEVNWVEILEAVEP